MKSDVSGRFPLEVQREDGRWIAYRIEPGKRSQVPELAIPARLEPAEIAGALGDLCHGIAGPGRRIRELPAPAGSGAGDAWLQL